MTAIMEKWETHLPQQAEEEVKTEPAHAPAEASNAPEGIGTALNPRIQALKAARDEAERNLQKAILDLETREPLPAFQKAKELFDEGGRIEYADGYTDTDYVVLTYKTSSIASAKKVTVFGMQIQEDAPYVLASEAEVHLTSEENQVAGNILQDYAIENRDDKWQVIKYLVDLTAECS